MSESERLTPTDRQREEDEKMERESGGLLIAEREQARNKRKIESVRMQRAGGAVRRGWEALERNGSQKSPFLVAAAAVPALVSLYQR